MSTPAASPTPAPWVQTICLVMLTVSLCGAGALFWQQPLSKLQAIEDRFKTSEQILADPFRLPGCISSLDTQTPCQPLAAALQPQLLPHATHLTNSLYQYTEPKRAAGPNLKVIDSAPGMQTPMVQGRHVQLTLAPKAQDLAQTTATCYAGDAAACRRCTWCQTAGRFDMYEQARVRSLGILLVDAKTGGIDAAASAYTPCYQMQQNGIAPTAGQNCPLLPNKRVPRLDRLGHQALEQTAKLGSISKVLIATGLVTGDLGGHKLSPVEAAKLAEIMTHSRTEALIDLVMCKTRGFDAACANTRLASIAKVARFLWADSDGKPGKTDVLSLGGIGELQARRFSGRLLHQPDGTPLIDSRAAPPFAPSQLRQCSAQKWRGCQGEKLVAIVAELFGTGDALASPVGVANAFLMLAALATPNQDEVSHVEFRKAHLVSKAQDAGGTLLAVDALSAAPWVQGSIAQVLGGMAQVTRQGTARSACVNASKAQASSLLPCTPLSKSNPWQLVVAGKTGTPVMSADQGEHRSMTLPQWHEQCQAIRLELAKTPQAGAKRIRLANEAGKCNANPVKWFAFMVKSKGAVEFEKVVVVLAERNWSQKTHLIDTPNDIGPNVAAEAGLAFVNALYQGIDPSQPQQ